MARPKNRKRSRAAPLVKVLGKIKRKSRKKPPPLSDAELQSLLDEIADMRITTR